MKAKIHNTGENSTSTKNTAFKMQFGYFKEESKNSSKLSKYSTCMTFSLGMHKVEYLSLIPYDGKGY